MSKRKKNKRPGVGKRKQELVHPDAGQPAAKPSKPARAPQSTTTALLTTVVALCVIGALLALYLGIIKWVGEAPAMCGVGGGCDLVQSSRWSLFLGVPTAFWGALTYVFVGAMAWCARQRAKFWKLALFVAFSAMCLSIYLTVISIVETGATCGYCLVSLGLVATVFGLLVLARPRGQALAGFSWQIWLPSSGLIVMSMLVMSHMYWAGVLDPSAGPESEELKELAVHLDETGAKFYGAFWCPACQRQKALFEASAKRLPFVECTPDGRGAPLTMTCRSAGVQDFPTWIIEGKRYVGVMAPKRLAELSKFPASAAATSGS